MTVLVALILSGMYTGLKDIHKRNEAAYNKRAIISAVQDKLAKPLSEMTDEEVTAVFTNSIEQLAIGSDGSVYTTEDIIAKGYTTGKPDQIDMANERKRDEKDRMYPLFVFDKDGDKNYITTVRGMGLWDAIWGNIALASDFKTITGVAFDHQGETPGLGAEIKDNADFKKQFIGKHILNTKGEFVGINIVKGGAKDNDPNAVDGITGATITAVGVDVMIKSGLEKYQAYFKK